MTATTQRRPAMDMWTVYNNPSDMPGKIVGRRFVCTDPPTATTDFVACAIGGNPEKALQTVRDLIQAHDPNICVLLPRQAGDEPHIIETWV